MAGTRHALTFRSKGQNRRRMYWDLVDARRGPEYRQSTIFSFFGAQVEIFIRATRYLLMECFKGDGSAFVGRRYCYYYFHVCTDISVTLNI